MIAFLRGSIIFRAHDHCILDVQGVGYKVFLDSPTLNSLHSGQSVEFFIHTAVSTDAIKLFGFTKYDSLELFNLLISVSGVGAKTAFALASVISLAEFVNAVAAQNLKALTKMPGIGKKSAERIILELKDKVKLLAKDLPKESAPINQSTAQLDATEALEALGYTSEEISAVFETAPPNASTEELIKFALKELNRF